MKPAKCAKVFVEQDVEPRVKAFIANTREAAKQAVELFAPRYGVPESGLTEMMRLKGQREKELWLLQQALEDVKAMFSKMSRQQNIDFMDRIKRGSPQPNETLQSVADLYREIDDRMYKRVQEFRPGLPYKQNHFRVMWRRQSNDPKVEAVIHARRPLEGSRGFLKHATLADVSEGIEKGLEPYSYNPQVLLELAVADNMKFITAQEMWAALKDMGFRQFVKKGDRRPEGYEQIDDRIAKVYFPTEHGPVQSGEWFVEENIARLINNFLSRDRIRENPVGRGVVWMKNFTTALELSLSPFHFVFETVEVMASQYALAITRLINQGLLQRDPAAVVQSLHEAVLTPLAPVSAARTGGALIKYVSSKEEFLKTTHGAEFVAKYPDIDALIDDLFTGGAKLSWHSELRNNTRESFRENVASGNYIGAALRALPAGHEFFTDQLFGEYIPRLKLGVFIAEYSQQLAQFAGEIGAGTVRREVLARQVWDRVENRFGEMNFDNLFWNRTFKTVLQIIFRSVTWKMGTIRAVATGLTNQARLVRDRGIPGRRPPGGGGGSRSGGGAGGGAADGLPPAPSALPYIDPAIAWTMSLLVVSGVIAEIIQLAFTGRHVSNLNDIMHPQIGVDERGKPIRANIPTYLKDVAHSSRNPGQYLISSFSSLMNRLPELIQNRDYFGNYIMDPDDPLWRQSLDATRYFVGEPFTISGYRRISDLGGSPSQAALQALGFPRAASDTDYTPAEQLAAEYARRKRVPLTRRQVQHGAEIRDLTREFRTDQGSAEKKISAAVDAGKITPNQARGIAHRAAEPFLVRIFKTLTVEQAMEVFKKASPAEREALKPWLEKKRQHIKDLPLERRDDVEKQMNKLISTAALPPLPASVAAMAEV